MDALRLLRALMGSAITGDQDVGVGDGSGGKKPPGFLRPLRSGERKAPGNVSRSLFTRAGNKLNEA